MGSLQENPDGAGNKGLVELNCHLRDEHKEVRSNGVCEVQGLLEEDESRIHEAAEEINSSGWEGIVVLDQDGLPKQQQQPQGPVVRWERFLPLGSPKVLLVESDDSTRQVLSALLRNCSYEVSAAANGLQAWKILEDLTNQIDLILAEVDMPCLSGIGLLCKIMNHKTRKNIPVIMMSSYNSMGIVFKCLSKGAADFLVKPIRKNELKNLWQHVWRRCHSSSGSGSGSGMQAQKSAKSRSGEEYGDTDSSNEDDNGSVGLNARDGSDNGSGTQSSWTKGTVETDKPRPMSLWYQVVDPHGSTCAQVIHPNRMFCNESMPMSTTKECQEQKEQLDIVAMGKDLEIGVLPNSDIRLASSLSEKISTSLTGTKQDKFLEKDPTKDSEKLNEGHADLKSNCPISELKTQASGLIGANTNITNTLVKIGAVEPPQSLSRILEINDKPISDAKESLSLELSLKRLRSVGDGGVAAQDDRNVFRRLDSSAFSRYNTAAASQAPTGYGRNCSLPLDHNSSEAAKAEPMYKYLSDSNTTPLDQGSNFSSDNDRGSTTKNIFINPAAFKDKSASTSAAKCLNPSTLQPVQNCHACPPPQFVPEKVDNVAMISRVGQPNESHHKVQVQNQHDHILHCIMQHQQQSPLDRIDLSLKNKVAAAAQCGSSNVLSVAVEGNAGKYSLIRIDSASNCGSNGANGSTMAVNAGVMNMESDNGVDGKGGTSGRASGGDQNRYAQREAALTKFRQKRKERCFEKKVRYQSRKRLAEQRPRMRGQFVRQSANEQSSQDADS
eukprot:TRINITY_DN1536_c0_g1_i1.p1 TRINITY_DN1536_c0_g1~~TRINITY_DN1536_c0_g1_i1.p1  ORF type:complete len:781 (-),score=164.92 TRINITY_DN1536_c0_g1_i1:222-2564(-)